MVKIAQSNNTPMTNQEVAKSPPKKSLLMSVLFGRQGSTNTNPLNSNLPRTCYSFRSEKLDSLRVGQVDGYKVAGKMVNRATTIGFAVLGAVVLGINYFQNK